MPIERYYFNLTSREWVLSFDEPSRVDAPIWGNTDARDFGVVFLKSIGAASNSPVEIVQSVVSAQIAVADPATPGTAITSATAGAASVENEFPFVLAITGFTSFLSGVTTPKLAAVEFRIATSLGVNRYRTQVFINPNTLADVTADTSAADRALGFNEFLGIGVTKERPVGSRDVWTDEVTGVKYSVGFSNGEFQATQL